MCKCNGDCNTSEFLLAFSQTESACGIGQDRIDTAIVRLYSYVKEAGKLLCEMKRKEMEGFVQHLYGLEGESHTAEDSRQEIWTVTLFYDYLAGRGCMAGNPVTELKDAAIWELMEKLIKREEGRKDE